MVAQALDALGSPVAVLIAIGRLSRFAALAPPDQARCLSAWGNSRLPPLRAAYQAIRKLVLAVHYADPAITAAIGYGGPFRERDVRHAWEGPLVVSAAETEGATSPSTAGTFGAAESSSDPIARTPITLPAFLPADPIPDRVIVGRTVTGDVQRRVDAVVIGSGAGGAVTAAKLAEAGLEVVVLEGGGWHTRADFTEDDARMSEMMLAEGAFRSTDDGSVAMVQGETAGGSTTVNWMLMLRTPDFVLEQWARESGLVGMGPREMAPVFDEVERFVHAGLVPDEAHSANNRIILDGARALGWKARAGKINATGCVRCGFCTAGCRHNAKQSALLTWLPRAMAAGATLHTDSYVERIEIRERDAGSPLAGTPPLKRVHARVRGAEGATHALTIDAPIVVVSGGAVGTPVLLARSGLSGGGVGHFLRLHPVTAVAAVYDREIAASTGIPMTTLCDEHLQWEGSDYGFWIETPPMPPWFTAAALPGFGRTHAAQMQRYNHFGVLISLTRDGADRTVSSGRVALDRRGHTSIQYRLTREDARRVRASIGAMAELQFAAGASEVFSFHAQQRTARHPREIAAMLEAPIGPNQVALFSAHVNGTCRMGTDPATSGATPDGERHGVRGLYISDGSLLPTAPGVNPQETIMAVASVVADRLVARHAGVQRT